MSQFAAAVKNPPWVRGGTGNLAQPPPPGTTTLGTSLLAAQAQHASASGAAAGLGATAAAVPAGSLATAAAVVAAAQTQQAQQAPAVSAAYGTGLAAITLTQSALQQGAVLPQGIAIPASLAATTQVGTVNGIAIPASLAGTTQVGTVNSGVVVALERLPQPGVALPTSLATTQVATVSYPAPRLLAQTAQFQAAQPHPHQATVVQQVPTQPHAAAQQQQPQQQPQQPQQTVTKQQRVFTGTVTKLHDNFGFVDEDVFFQLSVVKGNMPKVGERVLVEASYNPNMPFKWNATRIQVLPNQVNVQPGNNARSAIAAAQPSAVAATVLTSPVSVNLNVPTGVSLNAAIANIANSQAQYAAASVAPTGRWQVQQEIAAIEQMPQQRLSIQYDGRMDNPHSWVKEVEYTDMVENKAQQRLGIQFDGRMDNPHQWVPEMEYSEMVENKAPRISGMQRRHNSPPVSRRERERERESRREERRERLAYREIDRYVPPPPSRKRSRSPRRQSRSPPRRRQRMIPRYTVQIPKISLDMKEANVMELKKRYTNLYIPSDFCSSRLLWHEAFPPHQPFSMDHQCSFHIMSKDIDPVMETEPLPEATDTDHIYSAKVMLMATPSLKEIFRKSCALAEDPEDVRESFVHPTRLISFLVGLKGKNETVAIGGPWSPSLDGPSPDRDPSVLIRTAIRTCRALTGIDLSKCSQWYRFAEIYYRRAETTHKGRAVPTRVETVVLFLPDVWSCLPTRVEWDGLVTSYKKQLQGKLQEENEDTTDTQEEEENSQEGEKREPTHYSELDPKTIKLNDVKHELEARNLSTKGLKSQLIARLTKALKQELEKEETGEQQLETDETTDADKQDSEETADDDRRKKEDDEKRQREERERIAIEKRIQLPDSPAIIVHPSRTAKGGKFDCTIMSLSLLLDYRQEDNKEHSFEVSLFAEIFNEMMMRDFGFRIYRSLVEVPETKDDDKEKDKEKKKSDKKEDKRDRKEEKDDRRKEDAENDSDDDDSDEDDEDGDDKKDKEKRRKRKKKSLKYTHDPYLLLSYVYFDQTHCGYLLEKDLEEMLYTLGLQLSRAQVRKMIQKVCKKDASVFHYRKLTDKPVGDADKIKSSDISKFSLEELAIGNRKCLPIFKNAPKDPSCKEDVAENVQESESKETMVMYQGALVDVGKLFNQLVRSEKARLETEQKLKRLEEQFEAVNSLASMKLKHSQKLSYDLDDQRHKLYMTEEELRKSQSQGDKYQNSIVSCRDKLHAIISTLDSVLKTKPSRSSAQKSSDSFPQSKREDSESSALNGCREEKPSFKDSASSKSTKDYGVREEVASDFREHSCDKAVENVKSCHSKTEDSVKSSSDTPDKKYTNSCKKHFQNAKGSGVGNEENVKSGTENYLSCNTKNEANRSSCREGTCENLANRSETNSDNLRVSVSENTLTTDSSGSSKVSKENAIPMEVEEN